MELNIETDFLLKSNKKISEGGWFLLELSLQFPINCYF